MKIVIAPDSYKGSIYAPEAARAMREGVLRVVPDAETVLVPVADGGDGTLETLVETSGGTTRTATVTGPLGEPTEAQWGAMGATSIRLLDQASGAVENSLEDRVDLAAVAGGGGGVDDDRHVSPALGQARERSLGSCERSSHCQCQYGDRQRRRDVDLRDLCGPRQQECSAGNSNSENDGGDNGVEVRAEQTQHDTRHAYEYENAKPG